MAPLASAAAIAQAEQAVRAHYETQAAVSAQRMLAVDASALYPPFLAHLPPGGHILDAGCGAGRDSRQFLAQGYRVTAFYASAALCAIATDLLGQPVFNLTFQTIAFEECFDGVWANASLLHLPPDVLPDVLRRLSRALNPGGVLYASFMHGEGSGTRGGLLFAYQTEASFAHLLQAHLDLALLETWQSGDLPAARREIRWLHALVRKR